MPFDGVVGPIKAEPASHGLLAAASEVVKHQSDSHWGDRITYETESCNIKVDLWIPCDTGTASASVVDNSSGDRWYEARPYAITASDTCSTLGYGVKERVTRIRKKVDLVTPKAVEFELWTGTAARAETLSTRFLASNDATDVTPTPGTPVAPQVGLALLERALGDCAAGARGLIHATRDAATMIAGGVEDGSEGPYLHSWLGTPIAAGVGYDGTGPGNAAVSGTQVWMYATGSAVVHLGAVENYSEKPSEVVDTAVNDVVLQAERLAAAYWDGCCHYAVLIDLSG